MQLEKLNEIINLLFEKGVHMILIYIIGGYFLTIIINKLIKRALSIKTKKFEVDERKSGTLISVLTNITRYFVWFAVLIAILDILGFNISALIAGAGILGIGISFGAQDLVKDVISGFFIIFEDHFNVGDTIEVNGFKGEVISLGLKSTRIRDWRGEEKIVANGDMKNVSNFSVNDSVAVIDVSVAYESNLKKVKEVLEKYASDINIEDITGEAEVLGVQSLDNSAIVFRITVPVKPMTHFKVQREMRMDIKNLFDKEKIEIPFPQITINKK